MKVRFKNLWFAPSDVYNNPKDKRSYSGRRYKKGVHDIPEELAEFLPSSAEILDEEYSEPIKEEKKEQALSEVDLGTQNLDAIQEKIEEADDNFKKGRKKKNA